jgi:large subunit ribosomal protein L3
MSKTVRLMGIKKGMTRLFNEQGDLVVCTVISAEPHVISQIKRKESDGYTAIQLATRKVSASKAKNLGKPLKGHYAKAGVEPRRHACETRMDDVEAYQLGAELDVTVFADTPYVDVTAVSKGKGYQGVIKRHHFAGGPAAHGSGFHRHGGSTGMRTSPGRCLPGQKKAGRMGGEQVTLQNLKVVRIDAGKQMLVVAGAVPGSRGSLVTISKAKKRQK